MKARRWLVAAPAVYVIIDWVIKPLTDAYVQSHVPGWLPTRSTVLPVLEWIRDNGLGFAIAALLFALWDLVGAVVRRRLSGEQPAAIDEDEPSSADGVIYLSHPAISINEEDDFSTIDMSILAFNALPFDIRLVAIDGTFRLEGRGADDQTMIDNLVAPVILFERGPDVASSMSEFMPVIRQRLTTEQSRLVRAVLAKGTIVLVTNAVDLLFERVDQPREQIRARPTRSPSLSYARSGDFRQSVAYYASTASAITAIEG